MSYQGSDLTEREWGKALDDSVNWNRDCMHGAQVEQAAAPKPDLDDRALAHIKRIAESDPAYAWWASNHYQRLGELGKTSRPLFRDLPQQFINFENQGNTMTDYTKIDEAIIHEIRSGRNATWAIVDATDKLTKPLWGVGYKNGMRVVDRRLQALKKSGEINYARATGWVIGGAK